MADGLTPQVMGVTTPGPCPGWTILTLLISQDPHWKFPGLSICLQSGWFLVQLSFKKKLTDVVLLMSSQFTISHPSCPSGSQLYNINWPGSLYSLDPSPPEFLIMNKKKIFYGGIVSKVKRERLNWEYMYYHSSLLTTGLYGGQFSIFWEQTFPIIDPFHSLMETQ